MPISAAPVAEWMPAEMRSDGDELARAQAALRRGSLKRAVRHTWKAGLRARDDGDQEQLEAVIALAEQIREQASGSVEREAESVRVYCSRCLADEKEGIRRSSPLLWMFGRNAPQALKTCPDCAERIRAEARVCRFCGYRFPG